MKVVKLYEPEESPILHKLKEMDKKRAEKAMKMFKQKIKEQVKQKTA